jgi:hypothetical protein
LGTLRLGHRRISVSPEPPNSDRADDRGDEEPNREEDQREIFEEVVHWSSNVDLGLTDRPTAHMEACLSNDGE